MNRLEYAIYRLTDGHGWFETIIRRIVPSFNTEARNALVRAEYHQQTPRSRYPWGSPCRYVKSIDTFVHVVVPSLIEKPHPVLATYLRTTSPRWGRTWRHW